MNDEHAQRLISLLEELRDGQRLHLERQALALQRQEELLAQQRERLAALSERSGQTERLLATTAKVVTSARILGFVAFSFAMLLVALLVWALVSRFVQ